MLILVQKISLCLINSNYPYITRRCNPLVYKIGVGGHIKNAEFLSNIKGYDNKCLKVCLFLFFPILGEYSQNPHLLKNFEKAGRMSYKSEDQISEKSAFSFVKMIIKNGHYLVIWKSRWP
jgi:hypothetical protein